VKPYLQLEKLREGMFWVAGELFGFKFAPIESGKVPVYDADMRVWEVTRDGKHVGLWYFDPYARTGKRSGRWMNAYRNQERVDGEVADHRLEQLELREGQGRRADPDLVGGRAHAVPRVRSRAARALLERDLPVAVGHLGRARLRGVSRRSCSSTGCRRPRS
jgi:hypothetical protein